VFFVEESPSLYLLGHNPLRYDTALRPVWTDDENPAATVIRYEDRRTLSESLYRLRYPSQRTRVNEYLKVQFDWN